MEIDVLVDKLKPYILEEYGHPFSRSYYTEGDNTVMMRSNGVTVFHLVEELQELYEESSTKEVFDAIKEKYRKPKSTCPTCRHCAILETSDETFHQCMKMSVANTDLVLKCSEYEKDDN